MDTQSKLSMFKDDLIKSKKYWILFIAILIAFTLFKFQAINYAHPKMEIVALVVFSLFGVFAITYFQSHNDDKNIYKTAFVIILVFGLLSSFITPICYGPDDVEHFARAEMTSRGDFLPDYTGGTYHTIQSTIDLIEVGRGHADNGYDETSYNSTVFANKESREPINNTLVEYPNAFAQNPFFGYLAPAIGMVLAKLFSMDAIWLVWFGRIFNVLLYAGLASYAVKKTPILKMPMLVFACLPLAIYLAASTSIDPFINGLALVVVAFFFRMYKAPEKSLTKRDIAVFSALVLILGLSKVTCFAFVLLLFAVPRDNFKVRKYYYYGFISLAVLGVVALLWTRYYANPGFLHSWRGNKWILENFNSTRQMDYILAHKKDTITELAKMPMYFPSAMMFSANWVDFTDCLRVIFIGFVIFLYPHDFERAKSRVGALIVSLIFYVGTYVTFLLSWAPVGVLDQYAPGVQVRYFYPIFGLLPFALGLNRDSLKGYDIDNIVILCVVLFISFRCMRYLLWSY